MTSKTGDSTTYFTILPSNAGFTDQLFQFNTYYKLGLSLGYEYKHSTFSNTRHGAEHIFDFLGFNTHFSGNRLTPRDDLYRWMGTRNRLERRKTTWRDRLRRTVMFWLFYKLYFRECNFIDIGLGETAPVDAGEDPVEALRDLVRRTVARYRTDKPGRMNVVRFYLIGGKFFFEQIAPLLNQQTPYFPDKLNLRSTYFQLAADRHQPAQYIDGKLKVLVHIRLGDTAILETPWHTFVPLWAYWCISPLKEYPDKSDPMFQKLMDVEDFAGFLRRLYALLDGNELSTAVFSDGYKAAFRDLFANLGDLELSEDKTRALRESAQTYETRKFSLFDDMKNCVCRVGETNEDLQSLVHAALDADVIIVGCHQRMIPKFLSTYYETSLSSPPTIIALHNGIEPRYREEIGLSRDKARVYSVDISDSDYENALPEIVADIRRHHAATTRVLSAER